MLLIRHPLKIFYLSMHTAYRVPVLCNSFFYDALNDDIASTLIKWQLSSLNLHREIDFDFPILTTQIIRLSSRIFRYDFCRIELKSMLLWTVKKKNASFLIYKYKYLWTTDIFYIRNRGRFRKSISNSKINKNKRFVPLFTRMLVFTTLFNERWLIFNISNKFNTLNVVLFLKKTYILRRI